MRSLKSRLVLLWLVSLAASVAVGSLLVELSAQSTSAKVGRAEAVVAHACDLIRDGYAFYTAGWRGTAQSLNEEGSRRDLTAVVAMALARQAGVEGGIWQAEAGSLAYAYPSYPGGGPKVDLPAAELGRIAAANVQAAHGEQPATRRVVSSSETLLLQACPLGGPVRGVTAWTMARVGTAGGVDGLTLGLGVLLSLMTAMTAGLAWLFLSWSRRVRGVEAALVRHAGDLPPELSRTGDPDLDRIVDALNMAGQRLRSARAQTEALAARVGASERLAALGRVAAGVAHEIRNPIAAMRLRAENALASGDADRKGAALCSVLDQVARLDRLSGELLVMTQRREPQPEQVGLAPFLREVASGHADQATARGIDLRTEADGEAWLDPGLVHRVLDNLVGNAIRHTPRSGSVAVSATVMEDRTRIVVEDTGPGVRPELRPMLFEPFVTGRADGTGLGLAIARELAEAHGGSLVLDADRPGCTGARFVLDLPQRPVVAPWSAPWPPS